MIDPVPGTPFGRYMITREVGRGSMGTVYDAQDTTLNRRVALKVLKISLQKDPKEAVTDWQRFLQEARLTANLAKHANVVTIYDAGIQDSRRYIAMEFVNGQPFDRWRSGRSMHDQIRLLKDIALAMHHAHEHGIVHRDLKPGNVLVEPGGRAVITDFGLATYERRGTTGELTPQGWVVGSPGYMSPEQARGHRDIDRTVDVYALGVMLFEIAAGRPPFEGKTAVETLSKVVEGIKLPPSKAASTALADPVLDRLCLKAMSLNPHDRHPTALAFANELGAWLGDAAPRPPIGIGAVAAVAVAAILGAIGIAAVVFHQRTLRAEREREELKREVQAARSAAEEAARALKKPAPPLFIATESFIQPRRVEYNEVTPKGVLLYKRPGVFESLVLVPDGGRYEVRVTASCDPAAGEFAKFKVHVNGLPLSETALSQAEEREYGVEAELPAGGCRLGIEFTNDHWDEKTGEDRNLRIHAVSLRKLRPR
jgi:predicted Ser/Thr protein kinase